MVVLQCGEPRGLKMESFYLRVKHLKYSDLWMTQGCPRLCSLILLYVSQYTCQNAFGQKKTILHSLAITRDTRNEDREKSPTQAHPHLCNIRTAGTMDRTSAPPPMKVSLLRSISLNSGLLAGYMMTKVGVKGLHPCLSWKSQ
jgi:hypothetical protein